MKIFVYAILMLAVACGGKNNNDSGDSDSGDSDSGGGDAGSIDAPLVVPGCTVPTPENPECSDCIDNDGDGLKDSFDIECSGPLDDDEASFATGIPGDNMDAINQDCFFDGDSGAGNDGCNIHVCCLLGATTEQECRMKLGRNNVNFNPTECPPPIGTGTISQMCKEVCGAAAPPGCDCFGCCTVCDPATNQCFDIATNPNTSPGCTLATLNDPNICKRCTKVADCGSPCGGCILCPGQDPSDLPPSCGGSTQCPSGAQTCTDNSQCPSQTYCDQGSKCCVGVIGLQ